MIIKKKIIKLCEVPHYFTLRDYSIDIELTNFRTKCVIYVFNRWKSLNYPFLIFRVHLIMILGNTSIISNI